MRAVLGLAGLAIACQGSTGTYPQVVNQDLGPVLASPHVVPIFFAGDGAQAAIEDFIIQAGKSDYWAETTGQYGVGPLRMESTILVVDPPPATIVFDDVRSFLLGSVDRPDWPIVDENTFFVIFYPSSTTAIGACTQFGGYHEEIVRPGERSIVYAVVMRCPPDDGFSTLDRATSVASHEMIECSTDPLVRSQPAFSALDSGHLTWAIRAGGAEVTDLCGFEGAGRYARLVGNFLVERSWSNQEAELGHEPCVPVP